MRTAKIGPDLRLQFQQSFHVVRNKQLWFTKSISKNINGSFVTIFSERQRHTVFRGLDRTGLVKRGLVKRGLVKRGLVKRGLVKRKKMLALLTRSSTIQRTSQVKIRGIITLNINVYNTNKSTNRFII